MLLVFIYYSGKLKRNRLLICVQITLCLVWQKNNNINNIIWKIVLSDLICIICLSYRFGQMNKNLVLISSNSSYHAQPYSIWIVGFVNVLPVTTKVYWYNNSSISRVNFRELMIYVVTRSCLAILIVFKNLLLFFFSNATSPVINTCVYV